MLVTKNEHSFTFEVVFLIKNHAKEGETMSKNKLLDEQKNGMNIEK